MELRLSLTLCVGGSLPDVANKSFGAIDHASCWSIGKLTLDDGRFLSISMRKSGSLGSPASIFIGPSMISLCIVDVVHMIQCRLLQHSCPINATMPEADRTPCGAGCYWSQEDGGCWWSHQYHQYVSTPLSHQMSPDVTRCHQMSPVTYKTDDVQWQDKNRGVGDGWSVYNILWNTRKRLTLASGVIASHPHTHVVRKCSAEKLDLRREVMFSLFSAMQRSIFETLQAFSQSLARRMISSSGPD